MTWSHKLNYLINWRTVKETLTSTLIGGQGTCQEKVRSSSRVELASSLSVALSSVMSANARPPAGPPHAPPSVGGGHRAHCDDEWLVRHLPRCAPCVHVQTSSYFCISPIIPVPCLGIAFSVAWSLRGTWWCNLMSGPQQGWCTWCSRIYHRRNWKESCW